MKFYFVGVAIFISMMMNVKNKCSKIYTPKNEIKTIQYTVPPISCSASGIRPKSDTATKTPAAKGTEYFLRLKIIYDCIKTTPQKVQLHFLRVLGIIN